LPQQSHSWLVGGPDSTPEGRLIPQSQESLRHEQNSCHPASAAKTACSADKCSLVLQADLLPGSAHTVLRFSDSDEMGGSRHTKAFIIAALKQVETGRADDLAGSVICGWKAKFCGLGVSEAQRLRSLVDENAWLSRLASDLNLGWEMLKAVIVKKAGLVEWRADASWLREQDKSGEHRVMRRPVTAQKFRVISGLATI